MPDPLKKELRSSLRTPSGSRENQLVPCSLHTHAPTFHLCLHLTGTYFPVRGLYACFAIDRDMFRKILISCAVLANSILSYAFSNK